MTNHDIEVSVVYCRDCREVLGDRTSSWLFSDLEKAQAWMVREMTTCLRKLVSISQGKFDRGCKVSIRKYKGA